MATMTDRLQQVQARMRQACERWGRPPDAVQLLAVSKTFPPEAVQQAHAAGLRAFGENYIQEAVEKRQALEAMGLQGLQWHCIGPVQSNKTRLVATHFDWVHTIDRLKIAQRLSEQRPAGAAPLQVCLQVNIDGGPNKSGVAPSELLPLAQAVAALPGLRLRGLMCIPEPASGFEPARAVFARAHALFVALQQVDASVDTLSMGMSDDLEAAIAAGSTLVRVGSALFGPRAYPPA
jgi:PLP dependent protein